MIQYERHQFRPYTSETWLIGREDLENILLDNLKIDRKERPNISFFFFDTNSSVKITRSS